MLLLLYSFSPNLFMYYLSAVKNFCVSFGQLMSVTKLRLWFFPCTPRRMKERVARIFGIPTTDRIGTYLGTPIFTTRRTAHSYQYLVDNIQSR